ncbi:NI9M subunit of mitochondrial NADH:ubiquinone oxidoreductase (complex I), putative [Geotrichum candidum]|uniref:NI9M subunit of mitochondrial NADH:ubiquinone oxidoreductase (Complex I), putative n=1 Tax=Geotrichum candidum TaxID=1173061 RepID=A0A0J9XA66_GEOCN|nr:NI9M subunit of mitochondrial NADH:ubiquinone oxidoreductase (complex I), putative [Geotrichum candidum]
MSVKPDFWVQPFRYMRYCAHEKPQLFFSVVIGVAGPVFAILGTPLRRSLLFDDAPPIPVTYPLPNRPREQLTGFDDE